MARVEEAGDREENKEEETNWWPPEAVEGGRGGEGPSGGSGGGGGGGDGDGDGGRPDTLPQSPPPYMDQLPESVLENVLQFLVCRRDRNAASLVCRSWYRAEAHTRRELFVGNCYAVSPARALRRFCSVRALVLKGRPRFTDLHPFPRNWGARFSPWLTALTTATPLLERVCLKRMTVSDADLALLAFSFPSFGDLTLIGCYGFGTPGLAVIAELCKNLRVLDLIETDVEDKGLVDWISRFPETTTSLESLSFECVDCSVNFSALEALVARSPSLQRLRVNQNVCLGQLRRLMIRAPHLTHLGTGSFRPGIAEDLNAADLKQAFLASKSLICLSGFRKVAPEYLLAVFPVCANLVSLNLSYAVITAELLKPVMLKCHNLRTFWVLDTIGDEGLRTVAKACKNLHELRVFHYPDYSVSDAGLVAISNGCWKLQSILFFSQRMTNAALVTMSKNCPDLVVFRLYISYIRDVHCPDHVTGESMDEGFGAIVMNCKKLTNLSVSGLLTDKVFEYVATYGKLVRTLSVEFARNTDLSLKYVLEGCHRLQKLEIRYCPFGDAGLLSGIHQYYNMRFLWMASCKLSLSGCKEVAQRMPNLVVEVIGDWLDLDNCSEHLDSSSEDLDSDDVYELYLYRSLEGPRDDAPPSVSIL